MIHMATLNLYFHFLALFLLFILSNLPFLTHAISNCGGSCTTGDDCAGQLTCINGKCDDDPDIGTDICGNGGGSDNCQPSGILNCTGGKSYIQYHCSPPVLSSTQAILNLNLNDFSEGGDGGAASECDVKFHSNMERVVALSTGWYNNGSRCGMMIKITASNGRSTTAKVVDECDSVNGCDSEHAGTPPCGNNIVNGSKAVWDALGLNTELGEVDVTWSMVDNGSNVSNDESIKCFFSF